MKLIIVILIVSNCLYATLLEESWVQLNNKANLNIEKQSFCIQKKDIIYSSNLHESVRPASVSKLFTSLWAIEKLGTDFQFKTDFYLKDSILYIEGSKDPFFVAENLLTTIGEIQKDFTISKIIFDQNFYFNWSKNIQSISSSLKSVLNSKEWSAIFIETINHLDHYIAQHSYNYAIPYKVDISNVLYKKDSKPSTYDEHFVHASSPLLMHLKQVNIYSNNFYSDSLFNQLGSSKAFHRYIYSKFNIDSKDTYFFTGSGLGENRTSCSTALKVLAELKNIASNKGFNLNQLMSVAGVDSGTLLSRFKGKLAKKVIAKTGTLRHTSTLAGYIGEESDTTFAIFNHTYDRETARELQESFLLDFNKNFPQKPFKYKAKGYLSISKTSIKKETH